LAWSAYLHSKRGDWFEPDAAVRSEAQRALGVMHPRDAAAELSAVDKQPMARQVGFEAAQYVLPEVELASLRNALGVATTDDAELLARRTTGVKRESVEFQAAQREPETQAAQQPTHVRPSIEQVRATVVNAFGTLSVAETKSTVVPTSVETPARNMPKEDATVIRRAASERGEPRPARHHHHHRAQGHATHGRASRGSGVSQVAMSEVTSPEVDADGNHRVSGRLKGTVRRASGPNRTVTLSFPPGAQPKVGSTVRVYHRYMMHRQYVGDLKVIDVEHDGVTARKLGDWSQGTLARGDDVVVQ